MNSTLEEIERCRSIVRLPITIRFPAGESLDILHAADAVKQEYRSSAKWKKLRSREVLPTDDGSVFKIDLGQSVEFDWTWEGATAFRPIVIDDSRTFKDDSDEEDSAVWFDSVEYALSEADRILGMLVHMIGPIPE